MKKAYINQDKAAGARYEDWLHLRLALFSCYHGQPGVRESRMVPSNLTAWLIYRGWGEVVVGNQCLRAGPGEWLLPRPVPRVQRFSADVDLLSLNFYAQWPTGEPLFKEGLGLIFPSRAHPLLERRALVINRVLDRIVPGHDYKVFTQEMPLDAYLRVQRAFADYFAVLVEVLQSYGIVPTPPGMVDPRLARAVDLIQRQPMGSSLVLESLARQVGISAVHLNRLAVQHLGQTLMQHRENRRAEYARRCLAVPGTQIKEVGLALGFSTPGHFSRWFDRVHGLSPRQYRLQAQTPTRTS